MKNIILITFISIAALIACTTTQHLQPVNADIDKANLKNINVTLANLQTGYNLYEKKCSSCHRLHNPNEYTEKEWQPILHKMFLKAKITTDVEQELIKTYINIKCK